MPSRQHYAKIKDALAEDYNNKKLNRWEEKIKL
jgi:hypothetical protein